MVAHAAASRAIDPDRVFVTGLSAGGGMTAVMLATYPDVFAAGAIVAGLPYRCGDATFTAPAACGVTLAFQPHNPAPDRTAADWGGRVRAAAPAGFAGPWPRVSIWQGEADGTVDPANATELVEQWTNVHGVDAVADAEEIVGPATRAAFAGADGGTRVELYTIPGFGHATPIDPDAPGAPCGRAGAFVRDADICSTTAIAGFFGLAGEPPAVTIDAATVDGDAIVVAGTATDPDGPIAEVSVRLDGAAPQPAQTADGTTTWSARFAALPPDRFYLPVAVATDADGATATARGAPVALGTPPPNAPPVVAIDTVRAEGACVAVDGRATDDLGPVVEVAVTLGTRAPGEAALDGGNFTFQDCGLPDGVHAVGVTATDALGARATVSAPPVTVAAGSPPAASGSTTCARAGCASTPPPVPASASEPATPPSPRSTPSTASPRSTSSAPPRPRTGSSTRAPSPEPAARRRPSRSSSGRPCDAAACGLSALGRGRVSTGHPACRRPSGRSSLRSKDDRIAERSSARAAGIIR